MHSSSRLHVRARVSSKKRGRGKLGLNYLVATEVQGQVKLRMSYNRGEWCRGSCVSSMRLTRDRDRDVSEL